ncbi:uncharacterized protein LOC130784660 [Actinidia eriantha]|uniref:uncharacterized protein LOC130784660 n=1 Tax=Actinidia eriantha TaxID=165200 RepID=UPI00258CFC8A|nr:uncharacterized protein LOC130784660 [Actinidia eriantha]XP_057500616.1 uncharacterized protein LOC130784660 [Actinidia eriantha]XP_057500623.1 uncharacterized protein LOC130784660 [Actinidia eriantha]
MVALALSIYSSINHNPCRPTELHVKTLNPSILTAIKRTQNRWKKKKNQSRTLTVFGVTEGSSKSEEEEEEAKESLPTWARPGSDEPPPWARGESSQSESGQGFQVPFYVYLLASAITAIAAIGSVFEYVNQRPVFGVVNSDSIFYAPLLGFFAFTGIPTSAFLWFKSVQTANKEAEEQDRRDGYL